MRTNQPIGLAFIFSAVKWEKYPEPSSCKRVEGEGKFETQRFIEVVYTQIDYVVVQGYWKQRGP